MSEQPKPNSKQALEELQIEVEKLIAPMGYEVVALEQSTAGGRKITLFIDFQGNEGGERKIGLEDCVVVNRAVDLLFEETALLEGHYTFDVSSPGVERPLRKPSDFERFRGHKARLHTFRPLEKDETENPSYWERNKKQKNFSGRLEGLTPDGHKVKLNLAGNLVTVPLNIVSKAHLEFEGVVDA